MAFFGSGFFTDVGFELDSVLRDGSFSGGSGFCCCTDGDSSFCLWVDSLDGAEGGGCGGGGGLSASGLLFEGSGSEEVDCSSEAGDFGS